jgi:hypothetical protein
MLSAPVPADRASALDLGGRPASYDAVVRSFSIAGV